MGKAKGKLGGLEGDVLRRDLRDCVGGVFRARGPVSLALLWL